MSPRKVAAANRAIREGFREEVMQKLSLMDAYDLNVSWGFRESCCQGARAQVEVWREDSSFVGTWSGSLSLLMVTLRVGRVNPGHLSKKERGEPGRGWARGHGGLVLIGPAYSPS